MEWNILATAFRRQERRLLRLLNRYGEFSGSGYRDVLIGRVENIDAFLKNMETLRQEEPQKLNSLSQIVPIERTFEFDLTNIKEKLKEAILPYIEALENKKFYVRVKKRGHKGEISGQEIGKELDTFILDTLSRTGKQARIDFEEPDMIIIVETIENRAGVGLITREMKERYPFVRVK